MNLTTFRLRVSGAIGIGGAAGAEQDLIDGWVNDGIVDFLRKTKMTKKLAQLTLTAGQGDYEIDADILAFNDIWFDPADGTQDFRLEAVDSQVIRDWRNISPAPSSPPVTKYALEGWNLLMLYPTPSSSSDKVHILYVPRPTVLSTGAHDPSTTSFGQIPAEFHNVIEAYAKWKGGAHTRDQSSGGGEMFRGEYERGVLEAKIAMTRRAGQRVLRARIGHQVYTPRSPGVDLGY